MAIEDNGGFGGGVGNKDKTYDLIETKEYEAFTTSKTRIDAVAALRALHKVGFRTIPASDSSGHEVSRDITMLIAQLEDPQFNTLINELDFQVFAETLYNGFSQGYSGIVKQIVSNEWHDLHDSKEEQPIIHTLRIS